jgi:hypothetical protein
MNESILIMNVIFGFEYLCPKTTCVFIYSYSHFYSIAF